MRNWGNPEVRQWVAMRRHIRKAVHRAIPLLARIWWDSKIVERFNANA